jgi:hypothetical protein
MLAFHNTQSSITGGVLISGGYQFGVAKDDTRETTIKRSNIWNPRLISWIRLHSEKDERAHSPDKMGKSIFMADAVAALKHEAMNTLSSTRLPTLQVEALELKNIMNQIIQINE